MSLMTSSLLRYSSECRLRSRPDEGEDITSHENINLYDHTFITLKKLETACRKHEQMVEAEIHKLKQCQQIIDEALDEAERRIQDIRAVVKEKMEKYVETMTREIRGWKEKIGTTSEISCREMQQLVRLTDSSRAEERGKEARQRSAEIVSQIKASFSMEARKLIQLLQPFRVEESSVLFSSSLGLVSDDISEIKPDRGSTKKDCEEGRKHEEQAKRPLVLVPSKKKSELEHILIDLDAKQEQGKSEVIKIEEDTIGQLVQMNVLMPFQGKNHRLKVRIVRVLYYWIKGYSERLQAIVGDETGLAVANFKYSKQLRVESVVEMTEFKVQNNESGHPEIICEDYLANRSYTIQVNEKGVTLGEKIKRNRNMEWCYLQANSKCPLLRQVVHSLRNIKQYEVPFMTVKVTAVIDDWSQGAFTMVADSSGIMFAYLKKSVDCLILPNQVYTLKRVKAVYGRDKNQTIPDPIAYIDALGSLAMVERFSLPFWETSQEMRLVENSEQ